MKQIEGGVTAAKGFEAASVAAEIKYKGRTDMALVYSKTPCVSAGAFTTNVVKAAPVLWDKGQVESKKAAHAIIINSGIANACTGEEGRMYCLQTAQAAAKAFDVEPEQVLVASTGVIGMQLPIDRICKGVESLAHLKSDTLDAGLAAAKAIMTTDTREKQVAFTFTIGDKDVTIGGMAKGSGMIHPNMCTMLSFVTTDAKITKEALEQAIKEDVKETYNMISVDGDTSTNDTVLVLANGEADNVEIQVDTPEYQCFKEALHQVNEYLAKAMAGDGEGATALLEVKVVGADTKEHGKILAKSVVGSDLTKTALAGHDANWGRILCALGYAGVSFDPEKVDIGIHSKAGSLQLVKDGVGCAFDEEFATEILSKEAVTILADMHMGKEEATAWGCDLTHRYIEINADYRS